MFHSRLFAIVGVMIAAIIPTTGLAQGAFSPDRNLAERMREEREKNKDKRNVYGKKTVMDPNITKTINPLPQLDYFDLLFQTPPLQLLFTQYNTSGKRHLDKEDMKKAIKSAMQRGGFSEAELEQNLQDYIRKLDNGMSYHQFLQEIMACKDACGETLMAMATAYMVATADDYAGIVFFKFGGKEVESTLYGDESHGNFVFDNEAELNKVLVKWRADQSKRIGLDARASIPGNYDLNTFLSSTRVTNVVKWFIARGVPEDQIDYKWLGSYGPLLDETMADFYGIAELYQQYATNNANKTRGVNGREYFDGFNQSVCMFVY